MPEEELQLVFKAVRECVGVEAGCGVSYFEVRIEGKEQRPQQIVHMPIEELQL